VAAPLATRFWAKVKVGSGCWEWLANKNNAGYGMIRLGGKGRKALAHRVSYEMHCGAIPAGADVMHSCDNPACVRPDHLSVGSRSDNIKQAVARKRHPASPNAQNHEQWKRNVRASRSLLLEDKRQEVEQLIAAGGTARGLGRKFNVDPSVITRIARGIGTHR